MPAQMVAFTNWRAAAGLGMLLAAVAARSQEDGPCQPAPAPLRLAAAAPGATANPLKLPSLSGLPTDVSSTDAHLLSDGSLELDGDVIVHSGDRLLQARQTQADLDAEGLTRRVQLLVAVGGDFNPDTHVKLAAAADRRANTEGKP